MKRLVLAAAAFLALAASAEARNSDYHVAGNPGESGYFNAPDENGHWVVGYTGEAGQSREQVAEFALQRAAEFAAEQHQEWFAVLNTTSRMVEAGAVDDLTLRAGHFMGSGPQGTAAPPTASPRGGDVANTPSFGGAQVPNNVLERWQPRRVRQTILLIQLGSGDQASFPGVDHTPQIFPAAGASATPPTPN